MTLQLRITQVSRIMGGSLGLGQSLVQPGNQQYARPSVVDGKYYWNLLVGAHKVLLSAVRTDEDEDDQPTHIPKGGWSWTLDQTCLINVGAKLTYNIATGEGVLEVLNSSVQIEMNFPVATLVGHQIPTFGPIDMGAEKDAHSAERGSILPRS